MNSPDDYKETELLRSMMLGKWTRFPISQEMMSLVWKLRLYLEKEAVEFELRSRDLLMELESAARRDAFTPLEAAVDLTVTHDRACPMSFGGSD